MGLTAMKTTDSKDRIKGGFTLVELMIAISVTFVIAAAAYSAYKMQQKSYSAQDLVTEMQQNIRAGMFFLARDLRMAGYDPTFSDNFGITTATAGTVTFTTDSDENGVVGAGETLTFELAIDADNDGIADNGSCALVRNNQAIAEDIQQVQFLYTVVDLAGNVTQTLAPTNAEMRLIRAVTVTLLARSRQNDINHTDTRSYTLGDGTVAGPFNDNFRRRILVSWIKCRNMGLL